MWDLFTAVWLLAGARFLDFRNDLPTQLLTLFYRPQLAEISATIASNPALQQKEQLLASLQKKGYPRNIHGLWVQSQNGELLAEYQATRPIPAASLTKIATTLVAVHRWGLHHHFVTKFATNGQIVGDTLQGDLIIIGGGDPLFVWEDAIAVGNQLNQLGIRKVAGNLILQNNFAMNFERDPKKVSALFKMAVDANQWQENLPQGTPKPSVVFVAGGSNSTTTEIKELFSYTSMPLWQILKNMNVYSNNVMAEILAEQLGGGQKLAQISAKLAGVPQAEIVLLNGSGLGRGNQISPRAVVAMLIALQNISQTYGFSIADLLPVGNCRCGTIVFRDLPQSVAVKTGTLDDVSALAGIIQTKEQGIIWFAILTQGRGELETFHKVQDDFVNNLSKLWGVNSYYAERSWQRF
ncbi:MAG: D-alanyl-D-alanine carboxypeptidase [Pseudanabaenaceae cyanobacterium]